MKNERTSQRVAKIAAIFLPMSLKEFLLRVDGDAAGTLRMIKSLAGTAQTQAPDRKAQRARVKKNQRHLVRVKAEGFDQVLVGPVELMEPRK